MLHDVPTRCSTRVPRERPLRPLARAARPACMSFCCFIPGGQIIQAASFQEVTQTRWVVTLTADTPINELAAFITQPLPAGQALGCHVASAPFEHWHYLGSISNATPSVVFKTVYVWSASDSVPTTVQFGVSLEAEATLGQTPAEKVSTETLEAGRRIGQDLYAYVASFATTVAVGGDEDSQLSGRFHRLPA